MKYTISTFVAVFLLGTMACMNINSPNGQSVTEMRAGERGFVAGLGIESQDLVIIAEKMARGANRQCEGKPQHCTRTHRKQDTIPYQQGNFPHAHPRSPHLASAKQNELSRALSH